MGALPVLLAAFCYPLGNQLVWEAINCRRDGGRREWGKIDTPLLDNPFAKVFLLSCGTIPFWTVLYFLTDPGQWANTALVAIFSGVVATSLFLYARGKADTPAKLKQLSHETLELPGY